MPVPFGRIAVLALLGLAAPCRAAELPAALQSAAALSEQAVSSRSPSDANELSFRALQGAAVSAPDARTPAHAARRPALLMRLPALSAPAPEPPAPAAAHVKPHGRRPIRGAVFAALGLATGLLLGGLFGAGLGILDMGQRTKEMGKGRRAARAALFLPALVAGAVVGQLTFWAAGAKFMWDKESKPRRWNA